MGIPAMLLRSVRVALQRRSQQKASLLWSSSSFSLNRLNNNDGRTRRINGNGFQFQNFLNNPLSTNNTMMQKMHHHSEACGPENNTNSNNTTNATNATNATNTTNPLPCWK